MPVSKQWPIALAVGSGLVGLTAGLGLGWLLTPQAPLKQRRATALPSEPIAAPGDNRPEGDGTTHDRLLACEDGLRAAKELLELQELALYGTPASFEGVPASLLPDRFEETLEEGAEVCGIEAAPMHVDCMEYPCIALYDELVAQQFSNCKEWRAEFSGSMMIMGNVLIRDGERLTVEMFTPWPSGVAFPGGEENRSKRVDVRREELLAEAEVLLDARRRTPEEQQAEQEAFLQRALERQHEEDPARREWLLQQLDATDEPPSAR